MTSFAGAVTGRITTTSIVEVICGAPRARQYTRSIYERDEKRRMLRETGPTAQRFSSTLN